jgi:DNA-binding response OmpR family regulator
MSTESLSPEPAHLENAHVLVVDDESFIRNALQLYFETQGFLVSVAAEGESALKIFRDSAGGVDVVLLDLVMPGLHGLEVLQKMKGIDDTAEVVIATGCGSVHSAIEAMRFGAFDYITKPIVNFDEDLLKIVRAALAARRKRSRKSTGAPPQETGAPAPTLSTAIRYYRALEELAGTVLTAPRGEEFQVQFENFVSRHLHVESILLFKREPDGGRLLLGRWGSLPGGADPASEVLSTPFLWQSLFDEPPGWRLLWLEAPAGSGRARGEDGGTSCVEALRLPLLPEVWPGTNASASDILLLRSPRPELGASNTPQTALLSVVLGLALGRMNARPSLQLAGAAR